MDPEVSVNFWTDLLIFPDYRQRCRAPLFETHSQTRNLSRQVMACVLLVRSTRNHMQFERDLDATTQ
jgi:hypothetical protein